MSKKWKSHSEWNRLPEDENKRTIAAMNKATSIPEMATLLGISYKKAYDRVVALKNRGVNIPAGLQHGGKRARDASMQKAPKTPEQMLEDSRLSAQVKALKQEQKVLLQELEQQRARHDFLDTVSAPIKDPVHKIKKTTTRGYRPAYAVVCASDWHIDETVLPESVDYLNEYNEEIANQRMDRFWEGAAWLTRHLGAKVDDRGLEPVGAVVWAGGDMISGYIHDDLRESNHKDPQTAMRDWRKAWTRGLEFFLAETKLDHVIVVTSYGNHGRTTPKKRFSTGSQNSFEYDSYKVLEESNQDSRVKYKIEAGELNYVDLFKDSNKPTTIRFHHGDCAPYGGGVGGISVPLLKRIGRWDEGHRAEITVMGHWHQHNTFGRGKLVTNGSLIGYSAYSQGNALPMEPPMQTFFAVDAERGYAGGSPIWCDTGSKGP